MRGQRENGRFGEHEWKIKMFYAVCIGLAVLAACVALYFAFLYAKNKTIAYQKEQKILQEKEEEEALRLAQERDKAAREAEEEAVRKAEEEAARKQEEAREAQRKAEAEQEYVSEYELVVSDATWKQAKKAAKQRGGHLAVITSEEEQKIVEELIDRNDHIHTVWLGGYRKDDTFCWVNKERFAYAKWGDGEPNNETGDENYLDMYEVNDTWYWNDVPDSIEKYYSGKMGYVIEWEVLQ